MSTGMSIVAIILVMVVVVTLIFFSALYSSHCIFSTLTLTLWYWLSCGSDNSEIPFFVDLILGYLIWIWISWISWSLWFLDLQSLIHRGHFNFCHSNFWVPCQWFDFSHIDIFYHSWFFVTNQSINQSIKISFLVNFSKFTWGSQPGI